MIFNYAPKIKSKVEFSYFVETESQKTGRAMIPIIMEYMEETNTDYDEMAKLMSPTLIEKIRLEAIDEKLMCQDKDFVGLDALFGDAEED